MPAPKEPDYPKAMFLWGVAPIYATNPKKEDELAQQGWSTSYTAGEWPRMIYSTTSALTKTIGRFLTLSEAYIEDHDEDNKPVYRRRNPHGISLMEQWKAELARLLANGWSAAPADRHFGDPVGPADMPLPGPEPGSPAEKEAEMNDLKKQLREQQSLINSMLLKEGGPVRATRGRGRARKSAKPEPETVEVE